MHSKTRLFINGTEVELTNEPAILYTYSMDDIQNPTAIRNSYTKTIQVEGTPRNNALFNDLWDLTRVQPVNGGYDNYFNPSKRTGFELYVDGDLYETGYVKLDTITRKNGNAVFSITLYGGVGDFLYSLTYSDDGAELKLRDLAYIVKGDVAGDPVTELDFDINYGVVEEAWQKLEDGTGDELFDVINFMPSYNGYPGGFDSDKILINTTGFTNDIRVRSGNTTTTQAGFPTEISTSGETYITENGFAYGEIPNKMTEWETRDLRSYMQRPVLRVKKFIEACCDPTQNGGYEVELDTDFFNSGNTYYEKAWITLPLLTDLGYDDEVVQPWDIRLGPYTAYTTTQSCVYSVVENTPRSNGCSALEVTFRPKLTAIERDYGADIPVTADTLYTSAYIGGSNSRIDYAAYVYQLVGLDYAGNIVCGSEVYNLTSEVNGTYLNLNNTVYPFPYMAPVSNRLGYFEKVVDGEFQWPEDITLRMNTNNVRIDKVQLYCYMVANLTSAYNQYGEDVGTYGYRRGKLYTATALTESQYETGMKWARWFVPTFTGQVYYSNGTSVNSNSRVTKQLLLNLNGTPCDYLLGYLKTFGLYLHKDPLRKKVEILTRDNFYNDDVIDWDDRIDHSSNQKITPLTFNHKWYSFNYNEDESTAFMDKYYHKYGNNTYFGAEKVNTGYNFDSETEDLLEGIVYKNAIEGLEKSPYFFNRKVGYEDNYPTFAYTWVKYNLVNGDDEETVEVCSPISYVDTNLSSSGEMYDIFPKVQFRDGENNPINGSGVFVFFNEMVNTTDFEGNDVKYLLSDDLPEMFHFADNPCWLYTNIEYNKQGTKICSIRTSIPSFGRYNYSNSNIVSTWDFGMTKELYVPYTYYLDNANIYNRFWKKYVNDLYDIDTRIYEAGVLLPKTQGDTLLRRFFHFQNALWRINKIKDWNVCEDGLTTVEFVKVQDIDNYTNGIAGPTSSVLAVTPFGPNTHSDIPSTGGTQMYSVKSSSPWTVVKDRTYATINPVSGSGNTEVSEHFEVTFEASDSLAPRNVKMEFTNAEGEYLAVYKWQDAMGEAILNIRTSGNPTAPASGGTVIVAIRSSSSWTVTKDRTYVTLSRDSGEGDLQYEEHIEVTFTENDSLSSRDVKLSFANAQGLTRDFYVYQNQGISI